MKRGLIIFILLLPACLVAGAWTGVTSSQAGNTGTIFIITGFASPISAAVVRLASQITDSAGLMLLGSCLVLAAWIFRKSGNPGA
jgi:hypothetical protein